MFARRTLALGALAFAGFAGTASAETPVAKPTTPVASPTALPTTVVSQSTPVSTERTRRFGLRRTRITTAPVMTASYSVPVATTTTTKAEPAKTVATTTEPAPVMTATATTSTGRARTVRTGLFSRLSARR